MEILSRKLPRNHTIIGAGDFHIGALAHHRSGLERLIDRVGSEKNTFLALGGDLMESICVDDYRWNTEAQNLSLTTPAVQTQYVAKLLAPIKEKILFTLIGNHEMKHLRIANFAEILAKELEIPYGGFSAKLAVEDKKGRLMYKIFSTHGARGISSTADDPARRATNMRLSLKRLLKFKAGDCAVMIMGHAHKLISLSPTEELYLVDEGGKIEQRYTMPINHADYIHPDLRYYACTGSFLKTYLDGPTVTYSEAAQYDPVDTGYIEVVCDSGEIAEVNEVIA